jgi:hypothetical protein
MRADLGLDILDDLIECRRIDVALLGQDRLERADPELHLRQLGAVIVAVIVCGHGGTFHGRVEQARTARGRVSTAASMRGFQASVQLTSVGGQRLERGR